MERGLFKSGSSYKQNEAVIDSTDNAWYFAKNNVNDATTAPSSDSTNWQPISSGTTSVTASSITKLFDANVDLIEANNSQRIGTVMLDTTQAAIDRGDISELDRLIFEIDPAFAMHPPSAVSVSIEQWRGHNVTAAQVDGRTNNEQSANIGMEIPDSSGQTIYIGRISDGGFWIQADSVRSGTDIIPMRIFLERVGSGTLDVEVNASTTDNRFEALTGASNQQNKYWGTNSAGTAVELKDAPMSSIVAEHTNNIDVTENTWNSTELTLTPSSVNDENVYHLFSLFQRFGHITEHYLTSFTGKAFNNAVTITVGSSLNNTNPPFYFGYINRPNNGNNFTLCLGRTTAGLILISSNQVGVFGFAGNGLRLVKA